MEYKRDMGSKDNVHPLSLDLLHSFVNRVNKMAEIKFGLALAYVIGLPLWIWAYIPNFDTWKGHILFVFMAVYWGGMIFFMFRRKIRLEKKEKSEQRLRDLQERHEELNLQERLNKIESKKILNGK